MVNDDQSQYPLVNCPKKLWKITISYGKIRDFDWAIFNSKLLVYQRVCTSSAKSRPWKSTIHIIHWVLPTLTPCYLQIGPEKFQTSSPNSRYYRIMPFRSLGGKRCPAVTRMQCGPFVGRFPRMKHEYCGQWLMLVSSNSLIFNELIGVFLVWVFLVYAYTHIMYLYIYIQRRKLFAKFNAMHKLGSSPTVSVVRISVLPEVSHMGYR